MPPLVCVIAASLGPSVAILPLDCRIDARYATWTAEESRHELSDSVAKSIGGRLRREGSQIVEPADLALALKKLAPHALADRKPADFEALATSVGADFEILIELDSVDQKNRSAGEIAADLASPASETKVVARLWIYSRSTKAFVASGESKLPGDSKGPFFGTTDPYETSGSPADKATFVRLENRKRMDAIGKSIWAAIKATTERAIPPTGG